jgi:hypothetical protein
MSKMDDMRAMREARYEARRTGAAKPVARPQVQPKAAARPTPVDVSPESSSDELCGHRAISGRTCTREKGHAAKSHRYS